MAFKKYFELRGNLESKDKVMLTIIGAIFLIALWFFMSESLSKLVITQDESIDISTFSENDLKYYDSDSLLVASYDYLETLEQDQLSSFG